MIDLLIPGIVLAWWVYTVLDYQNKELERIAKMPKPPVAVPAEPPADEYHSNPIPVAIPPAVSEENARIVARELEEYDSNGRGPRADYMNLRFDPEYWRVRMQADADLIRETVPGGGKWDELHNVAVANLIQTTSRTVSNV